MHCVKSKVGRLCICCVVIWLVLVYDEIWGQLEKSTPPPSSPSRGRRGLRGSKMIPNDQYNMSLTIFNHLGLFWAHFLIISDKTWSFAQTFWPFGSLCFWSKKLILVQKGPKLNKSAQNGPKWPETSLIDHLGSIWTILHHLRTLVSLSCFAIVGPKRAFLDSPEHTVGGWQWLKLL